MSPVTTAAVEVAFPPTEHGTDQEAETVHIRTKHGWRKIRLHDYSAVFAIPGLYETIFSEALDCDSPRVVINDLAAALHDHDIDPLSLIALDLGAGNGLVGEQLAKLGVIDVIGIDLIPEAAHAAHRDRPGLYREYLVGDITKLTARDVHSGSENGGGPPNLLTCVSALGFGDIPVAAFAAALTLLAPDSWIAFNIKNTFLDDSDPTGFAKFLTEQTTLGGLTTFQENTYVHRHARSGEPINYTSIVAQTGNA
jgi:hypothetical protein